MIPQTTARLSGLALIIGRIRGYFTLPDTSVRGHVGIIVQDAALLGQVPLVRIRRCITPASGPQRGKAPDSAIPSISGNWITIEPDKHSYAVYNWDYIYIY